MRDIIPVKVNLCDALKSLSLSWVPFSFLFFYSILVKRTHTIAKLEKEEQPTDDIQEDW